MTVAAGSSPIPITVLTGFLGSGKTTVLNRLLEDRALADTLILINEFGDIGIDHDLVAPLADDAVIEMASGCLCCTIRGDLARTLRDAPWRYARNGRPWFRRVVLETTGIADPLPILQTLVGDPDVTGHYLLDRVVTVVDAVHGLDTLERQEEARRQVAVADLLLITKRDVAEAAALNVLTQRLAAINPNAPRRFTEHGCIEGGSGLLAAAPSLSGRLAALEAWPVDEHHHDHGDHGHDPNRHGDHIRAVGLTFDTPIPGPLLDQWLEALLLLRGPDILRVKGIINLAETDRPMVIHGVQHRFEAPILLPAWPSADRRTRLVFITRDLDGPTLEASLAPFMEACA
ncbi:MAG: GTP-binding protein [Gammaproteobacteria bacterium]|nr:MAG: GTP-binding protein [Gammaproteobacteria bacterium]